MRSDWMITAVRDQIVFVEDLNLGRMSVTNDAETVYWAVQARYPGYRVVYRDSELNWDELVWVNDRIAFRSFAEPEFLR